MGQQSPHGSADAGDGRAVPPDRWVERPAHLRGTSTVYLRLGSFEHERVGVRAVADGVELVGTGTPYAVGPGLVMTKQGTPYAVFTPFIAAAMFESDHGPDVPTIVRRLQTVAAHAAEATRS